MGGEEPTVSTERRYFDALQWIDRVLVEATTLDVALEQCLQAMLDIFECERAWLIRPCDPDAPFFAVEMERTRPGWPGAAEHKVELPASPYSRFAFETALSGVGPHVFDASRNQVDPTRDLPKEFGIRSLMLMALHPKVGESWCVGIHHCEQEKTYTWQVVVFEAIARRLADALTSLMIERDLVHSEQRFRALVEHAPEAIVIVDLDTGKFVEANNKARELFEYGGKQLLEIGVADVSPSYQPGGARSDELAMVYMTEALAGGTPEFEWMHLDRDGDEVPCEIRLVRLPHTDRKLIRGSVTDIRVRKAHDAERKRLEAQLVQSQKMDAIGQLTGGVAHDFNNLLTVILGNLGLLRRQFGANDAAANYVDEAKRAATRAAALTQRLLAFSRKQALKPEILHVNELVGGMEDMLRRTLGETIDLRVVCADHAWRCEADPSQLENAILNLAINSRDAMPGGGTLSLTTANADVDDWAAHANIEPGEYVELVVRDTGAGMDSHVLERVFEPFFTTKELGRGSGLGLSMVFGFVKQSGGHVQVLSEPGVGTSVKIYLPRSLDMPSALAAVGPDVREPQGHGETILVVEDEQAVRDLAVKILRGLGYAAIAVADAQRALRLVDAGERIDLLFTDVVLPGGTNGAQLARMVRVVRPELPVLFTSGYAEDALGQGGRLEPGVELLAKPYTRSALARTVFRVLQRRSGHKRE